METYLTSFKVISTVVSAVVLAMAWRILTSQWLVPKRVERILRQQGLSGNPYKFMIGDAIGIMGMRAQVRSKPMDFSHDIFPRVEPFLHQAIQNHGKNPFVWFGTTPVVVVTEVELAKEVLSRMSDFSKPHFTAVAMIAPGVVAYEGPKWAKHRKLVKPAFNHDKVKLMVSAYETSCNEMIRNWEELVSDSAGTVEVDVWPHLTRLTADVISRAAFGSSFEEGRKAFELIYEQAGLINNKALEFIYPALSYLPTRSNIRFNKAQKCIHSIIGSVIEKRRKTLEAGEAAKDDLLGLLIKFSGVESRENGITTEELIDECKAFYLAGQETTSVLLTYTLILLSKHSDWQVRAREEVLKSFGQKPPDFEGLNQLKTVTMILYEVLRLYPPLPTASRVVKHDTKVGDVFLPAGTYMYLSMIFMHHDPRHWGKDATEFKPERFSEGISKASREGVAFLPFGWGPRTCVGQNFALVEAKVVLAMILQRFSFQLSPSYAHAPTPFVTLQPQFGAHLMLRQLN